MLEKKGIPMSMSPELQQDIADVRAGAKRVTRPGKWRVERKDGRIAVEMFNTGKDNVRGS